MLENLKTLSETQKIAAIYNENDLSYRDLFLRVQSLAWYLKENTDINKTIVIYGDKENDMIVAFFACVLVKKTYISLPSVYPKDRLDSIIDDCKPDIMFNATSNIYNYKNINEINSNDLDVFVDKYAGYKELTYNYDDLDKTALIIYTSGSTGKPKGVEISYRNLESHIIMDNYAMDGIDKKEDEEYRVMNVASYGFVACLNIFHLCGYRGCKILSLTGNKLLDTNYVLSEILKFKPLFFSATPSFIKRFMSSDLFNEKTMPFFKRLALAGEPLDKTFVLELLELFPNLQIMNIYGSTETAGIGSICYVNKDVLNNEEKYLPIDDGTIGLLRIMDEDGKYINEDNICGECIFVDKAVTNGYFNDTEMTKKRYILLDDGTRAFKIGDIGYYKNGYAYVKGRKDNQVKIGSNRVEIEDVEANLHRCKIINEAAVICDNKDGINILVAFVSLNKEYIDLSNAEAFVNIKNEMKEKVESYKIPQKILIVDNLPRNNSGKIDKEKLKGWK